MGPPRAFSRRSFLRSSGSLALGVLGSPILALPGHASGADDFGPLLPPDANGLRLPAGFQSRLVATSGEPVASTGLVWHQDPDGGAVFPVPGGGWVYVSNAESSAPDGGVNAIRFASDASIIAAYPILTGSARNCAGGVTPWGTWLSCEEFSGGQVYECYPLAPSQGALRSSLGTFHHEAAAVDPIHFEIYLTEDRAEGLLYRYTPVSAQLLWTGSLEAAQVLDPGGEGPIQPGQVRPLAWHPVPDPDMSGGTPTRQQVPVATPFDGGEGCWYHAGRVYFSTKGDNRVWVIDASAQTIEILYDHATSPTPVLSGVDNVYVTPTGDVYVAEDGGNFQIVALTPSGGVVPVLELAGASGTELTGPALSPDGQRLYFSEQRDPGRTFEVTGPFASTSVPALPGAWVGLMAGALVAAAALALRRRAPDALAAARDET